MDRKPQTQRYPPQKNYNRNYVSEPKINNDHIDSIYTDISTGEYEDILTIIDSNKILNFRNKEGETLIHAILKNPSSSLTEQFILNIIEKLVHKNVSINSMNEYNQIPLHLAAKRGFYDIIDYLISLKSDFDKIDNYGNAPVHYLIDNFVAECKEGEYFKISNKKIKKTSKEIKYEKIAENYLILYLVEELEKYTSADTKNTPNFLLEKLKSSVEQYKFFKINDIHKITAAKKIEIDNLYTKHDPETLETNTKKILFNSITDFYNLYKDFNLENKVSGGVNELLNDDLLKNTKMTLVDNNNTNKKHFNEKIETLKNTIDEILGRLMMQKSIVFTLIKILYFSYYVRSTHNPKRSNIQNSSREIIEALFIDKTVNAKFYDFDSEIDIQEIISVDKNINFVNFIRSDNYDSGVDLEKIPLTYETATLGGGLPLIQGYDNSPYGGDVINIDYIQKNYISHKRKPLNNKKCILVTLLNILNYCEELLLTVKNMDFTNTTENYGYFYLNYINEIIINVVNNLAIYKTLHDKIDIYLVLANFKKLCSAVIIYGDKVYLVLISQVNYIDDKQIYDTSDDKIKNELKKLNNVKLGELYFSLDGTLSTTNQNTNFENIYQSLVKANRNNNDIIEIVNSHYSLKYLLFFVDLLAQAKMDESIKINYFNINNFYKNESTFPDKLSTYIAKYFADYKFTSAQLDQVNTELLKKYFDYDFNQLFSTKITGINIKYKKLIINTSNKFSLSDTTYTVNFDKAKFSTGYNKVNYKLTTKLIDNQSIFIKQEPTKSLIVVGSDMKWLIKTIDFVVLDNPIPIISLDNTKYIIQLMAFKIFNFLDKSRLDNIITKTQTKLNEDEIPKKIMQTFDETFNYLMMSENELLLKKVIIEKLVIFLNSYVKIQINKEVNNLLSGITDKYFISAIDKVDAKIIEKIKNQYSVQLKKYTLESMIPKLLKKYSSGTFDAIIDAIGNMNTNLFKNSGEKKLLLDKCIINNKIDPLKIKLSGKINLRILDKNGNTILNRLIDQYNEYAVGKVLEIDPEIYTYQNNRGQNSISYLYDVLNSIDKKYTREMLDKRIRTYESNLQIWIKSDDSFSEIELDDKTQMIYNVILNSLYLFNECMWMILLKAPNGWKYEDKVKLKFIVAKMKKFNIKEKLLIKSLTDADKESLKSYYENSSLNKKIIDMIKDLQKEIDELLNTNNQLMEEKKSFELVDKTDIDATFDPLILKNTTLINEKKIEITNLNNALLKFPTSFNTKVDDAFVEINKAKLIKEISMDWSAYNELVIDKLWNLYLPIIGLANNKNNNSTEKYMSFYNYGLLNLDYALLDESEIQLLVDYNIKIINNVYGDYYDLDKYEDIEYNYINDTILNIIYLNVVKIIGIEMYSALIQYLSTKYSSNTEIINVVKNHKKKEVFVLFEIIEKLLKNTVWDKLKVKNPDKIKIYQDESFYKNELISQIKIIFDLPDNDEDNSFVNKIIKFYTGLCANISYNINDELVNFLNDLKKHSLLFGILNLIKNKKK